MLSQTQVLELQENLSDFKIVPIAVFDDVDSALDAAELLLENSIRILEVTLRTDSAIQCIEAIRNRFPEMYLGCGSVLDTDELMQVQEAGVSFVVSPSFVPSVVKKAQVPVIPGVATPTELNMALDAGCRIIKVFPAASLGIDYIKSIIAPFRKRDFSLLPAGGINEQNLSDFLKIPEVIACGTTSILDAGLIEKKDFNEIDRRIKKIQKIIQTVDRKN